MEPHITIDFENDEGAVRRLLGVIEQRGFEIRSIQLPVPETEISTMTVVLKPRGEGRSVEILSRKIAGLYCVKAVQAHPAESEFERECA